MSHELHGLAARSLVCACALAAFSSATVAQDIVWGRDAHWAWPAPTEFGSSVAVLGDLTGDERDELALGYPGGSVSNGPAEVRIEGAGGLLATIVSPFAGGFPERFGACIAAVGDLDADAVPDFAIGAEFADGSTAPTTGAVLLYSGRTFAQFRLHEGLGNGDGFGFSISGGVDATGDGVPDTLVGAPQPWNDGGGYALLISGSSGAIVRSHLGYPAGSRFGHSVCWISDRDGDGVRDYAIGAPNEMVPGPLFLAGSVRVFSGSTGMQLERHSGAADREHFGSAIAALGDVNRDGRDDWVVGAPDDYPSVNYGYGRSVVISGRSGLTLWSVSSIGSFDQGSELGRNVASAGDWDEDGCADWIADSNGAALIYSGRLGRVIGSIASEFESGARSLGGPCRFRSSGRPAIAMGTPGDQPDCSFSTCNTDGTVVVAEQSHLTPSSGRKQHRIAGTQRNERFGTSVARLGDIDGDGRDEFAVGAPVANAVSPSAWRVGRVAAYRFMDDEPFLQRYGSSTDEKLGTRVSVAGDLNGDGTLDLLAGRASGSIAISGAGGALLPSFAGTLTSPRSGGADVNSDGVADVLSVGMGSVSIRSGSDGAQLVTVPGGVNATFLDDINGDGVGDFAVGDPFYDPASSWSLGAVWFYSGASGQQLGFLDGLHTYLKEHFGYVIANVGDVDLDGVSDVGIATHGGTPLWTYGGAAIHSGANLAFLSEQWDAIPYQGPAYAYAFCPTWTDLTGDGAPEAFIANPGQPSYLFGYTAAGSPGGSPWDYFGYSCDFIGDFDGDGLGDWAVGAPAEAGWPYVSVSLSSCLYARYHCALSSNSTGQPARIRASGSGSCSRNELQLSVTGIAPGKVGRFFMGRDRDSHLLGDGWRCVTGGVQRFGPTLAADSAGELSLALDLTSSPLDAITAGSVYSFQFWYRDPGGPGGTGINLSDAVELEFCP